MGARIRRAGRRSVGAPAARTHETDGIESIGQDEEGRQGVTHEDVVGVAQRMPVEQAAENRRAQFDVVPTASRGDIGGGQVAAGEDAEADGDRGKPDRRQQGDDG